MWKFFTDKNTRTWIDGLPGLVNAINNSKNRVTDCTPASVSYSNATQLWLRLYGQKRVAPKFKFAIGDKVRVSKQKDIFQKGYIANFSEEIFTVAEQINRVPPVYRLEDSNGEILDGTFYSEELCRVVSSKSDLFLIDKILKTRTKNGIKESLVKWKGYPESANSWEPTANLVSTV